MLIARSSRLMVAAVLAATATIMLAGCGFIAAGGGSVTKPSGFVLSGQAAVPMPAGDKAAVGESCRAPIGATDVAAGVNVTVTNSGGARVAAGKLGSGIVTSTGGVTVCSFSFQIRNVPGSDSTYKIAIGNRPPQSFSGDALRSSTLAILTITPTP